MHSTNAVTSDVTTVTTASQKAGAAAAITWQNVIIPSPILATIVGIKSATPTIITDMAKKYRIRKLTPTECFALMGVREEEIRKLRNCGVSESQQYKMAGNSIVVDVLMGIFGQMFNPQEKEDENQITFPWW